MGLSEVVRHVTNNVFLDIQNGYWNFEMERNANKNGCCTFNDFDLVAHSLNRQLF